MDISLPPLPPKVKRQLPVIPTSQPVPTDASSQSPSDKLSRSMPNPSAFCPASFLNPLYFHVNVGEQAKTQRSASVGEASYHFTRSSRTTANPVIKFSDSDSDSVYSLESVSSQSVKSERYVEGPVVSMKQESPDHVYEVCEIDKPKLKDIFDLVSFKSPLYGSIRKEMSLQSDSELYDSPLNSSPVNPEIRSRSTVEKTYDFPASCTNEVLSEVYDIPVSHLNVKENAISYREDCFSAQEADEPVDICCNSELDTMSQFSYDFEILCDIDGMLPPPYPPPPPPVNLDDVISLPKIPPRPLPPPIPKRPTKAAVLNNSVPKINVSPLTHDLPLNISELDDSVNAKTSVCLPPIKTLHDQQDDRRNDSILSSTRFDLNPLQTATSNKSSKKPKPPFRKTNSKPELPFMKKTSEFSQGCASPRSGLDFNSLQRFKKIAKTLSSLSSRGSTSSLESAGDVSMVESIDSFEHSFANTERSSRIGVLMCGYLYKIGNNGKDLTKKWYSLENGHLCWYSDHKGDSPQNKISTRSIVGVSIVLQVTTGCDVNPDLWCVQVFTVNNRHLLLGAIMPSECKEWVRHLSQVISPTGLISGTDACGNIHCLGQVYIKEGVSGKWQKGCLTLCGRWLHLWLQESGLFRRVNLQTVSAIAKESSLLQCISAVERGPVFHLNLPQGVLYVQGDWSIYTEILLDVLKKEWTLPPRAVLADHYVTIEGLPVIVDKCIKFVSTHGTTLEGIYRLSGSSSKIRQLMEHFMLDVWSVHLKTDDYSPHDVASVLKRFLRSLPECLLTEELYTSWVECSGIRNEQERLTHVKDLLSHLPEVNYNTLKKLIGHLCIVTEHSSMNLMPALNLAPVFGPTLLFKASREPEQLHMTTSATDIVANLIRFYTVIFEVEAQELEKERNIQIAVQKMKNSRISQKPAGDILVGIYIYSKDWGKCINVRLTPTTTAYDVCEYALGAGNIREPLSKIALMEVVCDDSLERPVHFSEFVLAITLRWMNGQDEAKDNYLCIRHNSVYDAILPLITLSQGQGMSVFGDMNYADSNSKSFKKVQFEFTSAKLRCYKTVKNAQQVLGEWNIEDIVWYLGAESKRPPASKWAFTFIDRNTPVKRTKSNPYFGRTICCRSEEELHKWIAAMMIGEYPKGLLPTIKLPDLLT